MTWIFLNFFFTIFIPEVKSFFILINFHSFTQSHEKIFSFCLHFSFHFRFLLRMKYNKNIGDVFLHTHRKKRFYSLAPQSLNVDASAEHKQFSIIIFHFARNFFLSSYFLLCSTSKPFHDNGRILFFATVISI